ncbi:GTP-binding protein [uncultured Gemmiger sp.]|uniref:GTP-binding protein n=1 Tax=uncultured Gemmiger sp. TaxID=1623490 RepID=UPI002599C629|nr:GTP-binding protein [uncultured Gemmiger sp.]
MQEKSRNTVFAPYAVGKTAVLKSLLPLLDQSGESPCVCKIDCLQSKDAVTFQKMKYPCVTGLSGDICPDHFLVSNLPELWQWTDAMQRNLLVIETAGLCHRCSPATKHMLAGCVVDCTVSCKAPGQLGPMLTQADFVVLTKVDMISQAEMEIICWQIGQINPQAKIFPVDALAGYGIDLLAQWLLTQPRHMDFTEDTLRHTMPSGVCSYCVGETRVGTAYQQGVVGKIDFKENAICKQ